MVAVPAPTQSRPEARVFRVEELLGHARAGRIRVPSFHAEWEHSDWPFIAVLSDEED